MHLSSFWSGILTQPHPWVTDISIPASPTRSWAQLDSNSTSHKFHIRLCSSRHFLWGIKRTIDPLIDLPYPFLLSTGRLIRPGSSLRPIMTTLNALRGPSTSLAASPTNTSYSGVSNYRTDPFKPISNAKVPPNPLIDGRQIIRAHFEELSLFLANHMAKGTVQLCFSMLHDVCLEIGPNVISIRSEPAGARASAREKLTRLTRQQFQELSTDVYDELIRRKNNSTKNEGNPMLVLSRWVAFAFESLLTIICFKFPSCLSGMTFIQNGIKPGKSLPRCQKFVSRIYPVTSSLSWAVVILS